MLSDDQFWTKLLDMIASFVCNHAKRIENKKLRSESVSIYYVCTGSQLIILGQSRSKMNAKVKLISNFIIDN